MKNIERYLVELKNSALAAYKKSLAAEAEDVLRPLKSEKESLQVAVTAKQDAIAHQKKRIAEAVAQSQARAQAERARGRMIAHVWERTMDAFFTKHADAYIRHAASQLPEAAGTVRYRPEGFMTKGINTLRTIRPQLSYVADTSVPEGFVYEGETVVIDCTKDAFSQEKLRTLRTEIFDTLRKHKAV